VNDLLAEELRGFGLIGIAALLPTLLAVTGSGGGDGERNFSGQGFSGSGQGTITGLVFGAIFAATGRAPDIPVVLPEPAI